MADTGRWAARAPPTSRAPWSRWSTSGKSKLKLLYPDEMPLLEKIKTIAKEIYRAKDIDAPQGGARPARRLREHGLRQAAGLHGQDPVSASPPMPTPRARRPTTSSPIREVRLSAGAEFVVAICGEIMTMPGLPRVPAADAIDVGPDGRSSDCSDAAAARRIFVPRSPPQGGLLAFGARPVSLKF